MLDYTRVLCGIKIVSIHWLWFWKIYEWGAREKNNNQTFTQGSAILKIKYYNPKNLIVEHLLVKEKEKKIEFNRMRNGYITQVLTSVDIQEIVKTGGRVFEIYEVDFYRENFEINPFEKVIDELFALRQKNKKKENNEVLQLLVMLIMNASYGEFLRKDITESYPCKIETWMMSEYDERVLDYQKINYIVKIKDDEGLLDEIKKANTSPLQLVVYIIEQ